MKISKISMSVALSVIFFAPVSAFAQNGTAPLKQDGATSLKQDAPKPSNAVVYRNEFSVGYGFPNTSDVIFPLFKVIGSVVTLSGYSEKNLKIRGGLHVAYKHRFDRIASLGVTFAYGSVGGNVWWGNDYWGKSHEDHYTLALECDFRYLTRRVVNLYSTVGVAATYSTHRFTSADPRDQQLKPVCFVLPNAHVSLIGVKVGGYRFGGFAELGVGYKGVFNCGVYVRF